MKYPYIPIVNRRKLSWPENKRLAIIITINLETWDLTKKTDKPYYAGGPPILPDLLPGNVPDFPNYMWREYGQRVGVWRLFELFDRLGIKPGCTVNAETCNRRREMVDAAMKRGYELIPHNFEQGELLTNFYNNPKKEEELIKRTLKVFEETTKTKPKGWLSSSLRGTLNTADILVRNGLKFYCDTMNDDQPYMIETPSGEITAVPYNNEINDFTLLTRRGHTTDEFRDILLEEMSVLYEESITTAKIMNIGLHPHVSGRAYRIRAIKEFIQEAQKLEGVWWTTRSDLTDWYATCQQEHIPRSR
ncbi:MAG: polysaccharide deacetylase [Gammaproteobacteria bacterium]|nr:polysaccharide deacetylase [Gammaproteobacteria bacterium]